MLIESYKQMGYKAEATELTAETLVAANYGSVWTECDIVDESTYNARKPRRASYSALQGIGGTAIGKVTGSFEPRPSGTNGTPPDWYAIAAAAGGTVATDNCTFDALLRQERRIVDVRSRGHGPVLQDSRRRVYRRSTPDRWPGESVPWHGMLDWILCRIRFVG